MAHRPVGYDLPNGAGTELKRTLLILSFIYYRVLLYFSFRISGKNCLNRRRQMLLRTNLGATLIGDVTYRRHR